MSLLRRFRVLVMSLTKLGPTNIRVIKEGFSLGKQENYFTKLGTSSTTSIQWSNLQLNDKLYFPVKATRNPSTPLSQRINIRGWSSLHEFHYLVQKHFQNIKNKIMKSKELVFFTNCVTIFTKRCSSIYMWCYNLLDNRITIFFIFNPKLLSYKWFRTTLGNMPP